MCKGINGEERVERRRRIRKRWGKKR